MRGVGGDFLTKMGIKTVPHPPYGPDLAPSDFCLFPKLRGCRYETTEEMNVAVTKVIDMLTQEDFHEALQKLFEHYKCITAGEEYFERDLSFMCVLSIKVTIRKSLETYLMILVYIYIYIYILFLELLPRLLLKLSLLTAILFLFLFLRGFFFFCSPYT